MLLFLFISKESVPYGIKISKNEISIRLAINVSKLGIFLGEGSVKFCNGVKKNCEDAVTSIFHNIFLPTDAPSNLEGGIG